MRVWSVGVTVALAAVLTTKCGVVAAAAQVDRAQAFPNRAIKIIVPFPAGGPTDINIRIIAQHMSEDWKNPVVIENRPGASTAIGAQAVARAEPDGYTLLAAMDSTLVMNPAAAAPLSYDPFNDFAAITMTAKNTSLLTVRASDGPHSVKELIARGSSAGSPTAPESSLPGSPATCWAGLPASICSTFPTRARPRWCRGSCPAASILSSTALRRACR